MVIFTRFIVVFLSCMLFFPRIAFSWNELGHMVIAEIAYQNLKPSAREKVDELVSYLHQEYAEMKNFVNIAYWPDAIRSQRIETFTHWHYIDVPFSNDNTPLTDTMDSDNGVWAFNHIVAVVKNEKANVYERVRFLSFLTHIVGDLHQPLHTVTMISAAHPHGDQGGNAYYIHYYNQRVRLHKLWDSGIDVFYGKSHHVSVEPIAQAISSHYPKSYFGNRVNDLNPEDWVKEGMVNAKQYVYNTPENKQVSADYIEAGRQLAEQEAALAGYRLALLLNQFLP